MAKGKGKRKAGEGTRTDRLENAAAHPPRAPASLLGGAERKKASGHKDARVHANQ